MSYDPNDAAYDEFIDQLYKEFRESALDDDELYERIVDSFRESRLSDYYTENSLLTKSAREALSEAKALLDAHPRSAQILAVASSEVVFRDALLTPILHGSFHTESTAGLLVNLIVKMKNRELLKALLDIMAAHTRMDIRTFRRPDSKKPLWEEMENVRQKRHRIVHQVDTANRDEAELAIAVAETLLEDFFARVIANLGLHLHDGERVCGSKLCGI